VDESRLESKLKYLQASPGQNKVDVEHDTPDIGHRGSRNSKYLDKFTKDMRKTIEKIE
jgi:hypothetical protein